MAAMAATTLPTLAATVMAAAVAATRRQEQHALDCLHSHDKTQVNINIV